MAQPIFTLNLATWPPHRVFIWCHNKHLFLRLIRRPDPLTEFWSGVSTSTYFYAKFGAITPSWRFDLMTRQAPISAPNFALLTPSQRFRRNLTLHVPNLRRSLRWFPFVVDIRKTFLFGHLEGITSGIKCSPGEGATFLKIWSTSASLYTRGEPTNIGLFHPQNLRQRPLSDVSRTLNFVNFWSASRKLLCLGT